MGVKKQTAPVALYRKYRSRNFQEVVGQDHITQTLERAIKQQKINHAYLFTGPRGTGKTSVARILAHAINQLPYSDETHLDIIEIDAASNRRIDDIRDLRDKVQIAPVSAPYKVYIIDEVHMLTSESFNALLKTLEEPPAHVVFILATTEAHKLPATIISRTQRHSFRSIADDEVARHLKVIAQKEKLAITDEALNLLAHHGGGSFRDSISLLDQLSGAKQTIDAELVGTILGLAPTAQLESLLTSLDSGPVSSWLEQLEALKRLGLTSARLATQLVELIRQQLPKGTVTSAQLQLMRQLLEVSNSPYPDLSLETSLLEYSLTQTASNRPLASPVEIARKPLVITQPKGAIQKKTLPPAKASPQPDFKLPAKLVLDDHWPTILQAVKQQNNSLYTVLRLAQPTLDKSGVTLTFAFAFHQKRVEEHKHQAVLAQVLRDKLKLDVPIQTAVDPTLAPQATPLHDLSPPPATDSPHASLISEVQAIMGGGEIVNA